MLFSDEHVYLTGYIGVSTLPNNTSTCTVGQVLSILNATTKTSQWITIPTQISSFVNYNLATSNLISNISGTPSTITSISLSGAINGGAITGSSLSAGTGIISTSGAINGGVITGSSLSAGTGTISTSGAINGGALVCTTIQNNGNNLNCGDITCGVINTSLSINSTGTSFSTAINAKKIY